MDLINNLILNTPIDLYEYNLGTVYQPTLKELITIFGDEKKMVSPFETTELIHYKMDASGDSSKVLNRFHIFLELDGILNNPTNTNRILIIKALSLLYRTEVDNIKIIGESLEEANILIKDKGVLINVDNFNKLLNVVFFMFNKTASDIHEYAKEKKDNWIRNSGSKREEEMIQFFKKREEERQRKAQIKLHDIISYVSVLGKYSYNEISNFTYWQLSYQFSSLLNFNQYNEQLGYMYSFKFDIKPDELKSWKDTIKSESKFII